METSERNHINIEDEMRRSYLDYAMSVIIGRALPDVRDGLKPVHRRVLWAMHQGLPDSSPYFVFLFGVWSIGDGLARFVGERYCGNLIAAIPVGWVSEPGVVRIQVYNGVAIQQEFIGIHGDQAHVDVVG